MNESVRNPWYSFQWEIDNSFSVISLLNEPLKSPLFNFRNTKWHLLLNREGPDNLCVVLKRSRHCNNLQTVLFVNVKIGIVGWNDSVFYLAQLRNFEFSKNSIVKAYASWRRLCQTHSISMHNDVLNLICALTIPKCTTIKVTKDILMLSSDMSNMLDKKLLSDFQVTVGNKVISLHKAILHSRGKILGKFLSESKEKLVSEITKSFDRPEPFEHLIRYLYSCKVTNMDAEISAHLQMATVRYNIYCLKRSITTPLRKCGARTRITVEHIFTSWNINCLSALRVAHGKTDSIPLRCMKFKCCLVFRLVRQNDRLLLFCRKVNANSRSSTGYMVVGIIINLVGCYDSLDCFKVQFQGDEMHWLEIETNFAFRHRITLISNQYENLTMNLQVFVSDEVANSSIERFVYESELPITTIEDFESFVSNLKTLFTNGAFSDVIVSCNSCQFNAHKAILCARSPVISKIFEERQDDEYILNVGNREPKALKQFLLYIYTADISYPGTYTICRDLYELSHDYEIFGLREKCSEYMETFIWPNTFCNILIIADRYSDHKLKMAIYQKVYGFTEHFLRSPEWKRFLRMRPGLAGEVLMIVAIPLMIILAPYIIHNNKIRK